MLARPLPRRVAHKEGETGLSVALRLANRHGDTWKVFAGATGLPISGLKMSEHLEELSACSAIPSESLRVCTPVWLGHEVDVLGHRFDRSRFLRLNLRICPHCMEEDVAARAGGERAADAAYLRLDWCLAFVFGCVRHRVRLVTRCPSCGDRPRWNVGRIDACHCGASLLRGRPPPLSADEADVLADLAARLHGRPRGDGRLAAVGSIPLSALVNLLRLLGQVAEGGRHASTAACALEVDDLPELLVRGAGALSSLPGSFEAVLDTLATRGPGSHRGLTEVYGLPIVRWMRSNRPFIEVLRPIFEDHSAVHSTLPAHRRPGALPSPSALSSARRRGFLSVPEMKRLIAAVGWAGTGPARRAALPALRGAVLPLGEAAAHLGVPWRCFRQLREAGLVRTCWEVVGKAERQYFYRAELDDLINRLRADAPVYARTPRPLVGIAVLSKTKGLHVHSVIGAMVEGSLTCRGVIDGPVGVQALLFEPEDVDSCFRVRPAGTTTRSNARELLGLQTDGWNAIEGMLLPTTRSGPMTYVSWEALECFDDSYISLRRIATLTGMVSREVRARLDTAGVKSIVSGKGFAIFGRREAEAVISALRGSRVVGSAGEVRKAAVLGVAAVG